MEHFTSPRRRVLAKTALCLITFLLSTFTATAQPHQAIKPYVDFLSGKQMTAKEYILSLFKDHDIVFISERDHRDITQYELYLEVLRDSFFINRVGVVFTEVGSRSINPELNTFLHTDGLSKEEVDRQILHFRRNMLFYPVWHPYNWSYLAGSIYQINSTLPDKKKISFYPSDIFFNTKHPTKENLKEAYGQFDDYFQRDSLMADYIIRNFREMKTRNPKQKALVIMNSRHAYSPGYHRKAGVPEQNVARFVFEAFPDRCANVLVNQFALSAIRSDNDVSVAPTQNGKWDAAFQYQKINNAGFDFSGSPFGKDAFDHDPRTCPGITYQDVFTGYVYYRTIPEFRIVIGIPHIAEDGFAEEYMKREDLYYEIFQTENPHEARQYIWDLNTKQEKQEDFMEELMPPIRKWLGQ